jgi:hypothetical protein
MESPYYAIPHLLSFDEKIGGSAALKALQRYTHRIAEAYGKKAFQHFREGDMRVLAETKFLRQQSVLGRILELRLEWRQLLC